MPAVGRAVAGSIRLLFETRLRLSPELLESLMEQLVLILMTKPTPPSQLVPVSPSVVARKGMRKCLDSGGEAPPM